MIIFGLVLVGGIGWAASQLLGDLFANGRTASAMAYFLLGIALLIALGFEFVNGFHDTANAVATVIYTHSLEPHIAVMWSGMWNLIGVLLSSGAVAFAVVSLLPVELILKVGSGAGFAMVFALLTSAILWNLSTWWYGLPASSSHTLIGSIIGVGVANQLMSATSGTSGVDWSQVGNGLPGAAGFARRRVRLFRSVAAVVQVRDQGSAALRGAQGRCAAAILDSRPAGADLHRCELCPRLQRWAKGHGTHHADPDRHGAHRLCL
jgi:hypothetical protein